MKKQVNKIILCFTAIFVFTTMPESLFSQSARFKQLTVDDGLTQNSVFSITQDKQGFMWIGTTDGLNKYDGHSVITYRHDKKDTNSLSSGNIVCLHADNNNNLWIGTRYGLNRLDLVKNKIHRYKIDTAGNGYLNSEVVLSLNMAGDLLYVGTGTGGLNVLNTKTGKFSYVKSQPDVANSLQSNLIRSISIDNKGVLWLGHSNNGVTSYDPKTKKFRRFNGYNDGSGIFLNNEVVRNVFCDSKNRVWISTWSGGVNVFHQDENKMYSNRVAVIDAYHKRFAKDNKNYNAFYGDTTLNKYFGLDDARMVFGFTEDKQGNIWIATVEQGLLCYNPYNGKIHHFKNNPNDPGSICDNNLLSLYVDRSGLVWTGSLSSGVSVFNPYTYRFGHYKASTSDSSSLSNSQVWSLHKGKKTGNVYIGIMGGVYVFDVEKNKFVNFAVDHKGKNLLSSQAICQSLLEDRDGNIWISVNGAGIYVYDPVKKTLTNHHPNRGPGSLGYMTVLSMSMNSKGEIFLSFSFKGIDKYLKNENKFHHYLWEPGNPSNKFTSDGIEFISFDNDDNLWIATDSGVNVMSPAEKMTYYLHDEKNPSGLPSDEVISIYHDRENTTWIGTAAGLSRFDKSTKTFENLSAKYHFAEDGVIGIAEDNSGNLWLLGFRGLVRVNKEDFSARKYDHSDGLQSNEFPYNVILGLENGNIICGGSKGLNYFDPDELMTNTNVPGIAITGISLRNVELLTGNSINFTNEIILDYDHYFFTIEFAALDFTNTAKNRYKYKLEGFHDSWVELGNKSSVTFVNLDPGEYTFTVTACNNDGVWNEKGTSVRIVITPPFWQTTWFYILCGVLISAGSYSYLKYRERRLVREKRALEDKVDLRTKELREEKEKVEEAHKEITDSIYYAKTIQEALLPDETEFKKIFPESFILFRPKNIVSGDFFWIEKVESLKLKVESLETEKNPSTLNLQPSTFFLAVADCTGHGVPGGFMSMLGTSFLKEIVNDKKVTDPAEILNQLRDKVIEALRQKGIEGENKDGMDISLAALTHSVSAESGERRTVLQWAGANNPLWVIEGKSHEAEAMRKEMADSLENISLMAHGSLPLALKEYKADKQPIGYYFNQKPFTEHEVELCKGDMIYLFSDGFADQFGGLKGKKLKYRQLQEIILNISHLPVNEQKEKLECALDDWMGDLEQNDDITFIGIRV